MVNLDKEKQKKLKLLYLRDILMQYTDEEHGLNVGQIAEKLNEHGIDAERKTIYKDIKCLNDYGDDVNTVGGGKNTSYAIFSRMFELPELKLIVDAIQSSKFITSKKSNILIKKMERFCSEHQASALNRQVYISQRIKTDNEKIYLTVDAIHEAINNNKKVQFQYFQWNEKKEKVIKKGGQFYIISPWVLTWDDENYYMIGYDHDSDIVKHYRVDKMLKIEVHSDEREGEDRFKDFDLGRYATRTFAMFNGIEKNVTMLVKNDCAGIFIDRFGTDIIFRMSKEHPGYSVLTVTVNVSPHFLGWIISLGNAVKIIGPEDVMEQMKKLISEQIKQYQM